MDRHILVLLFVISSYLLKTNDCYKTNQKSVRETITKKERAVIMEESVHINEAITPKEQEKHVHINEATNIVDTRKDHPHRKGRQEVSKISKMSKLYSENNSNKISKSSLDSTNEVLKQPRQYGTEKSQIYGTEKFQLNGMERSPIYGPENSQILYGSKKSQISGTEKSQLNGTKKSQIYGLQKSQKYWLQKTVFNEKKNNSLPSDTHVFLEFVKDINETLSKSDAADSAKMKANKYLWSKQRKRFKSQQMRLLWMRRKEKGIIGYWTDARRREQSELMKAHWKKKLGTPKQTIKIETTKRTWVMKKQNGPRALMMLNKTWGHWNRNKTKRIQHSEFLRKHWQETKGNRTFILERLKKMIAKRKQFWNQTDRRKKQSEKMKLFWKSLKPNKRRFILRHIKQVRKCDFLANNETMRKREEYRQKRYEARIKRLEEKERKRQEREAKRAERLKIKFALRRKRLKKRLMAGATYIPLKARMEAYWNRVRECERRLKTEQSPALRAFLANTDND